MEMILRVNRYNSQEDFTDGLLHVDEDFECFTLEDEFRTEKVWGETRIPDGEYEIGLRTVGGFHQRYSKRFASMHKGMLQVMDVPGFEHILIHIGNDDDDTAGCLLVGSIANSDTKGYVGGSVTAYKKLYKKVVDHLEEGGTATIIYNTIG